MSSGRHPYCAEWERDDQYSTGQWCFNCSNNPSAQQLQQGCTPQALLVTGRGWSSESSLSDINRPPLLLMSYLFAPCLEQEWQPVV
jgi:hypothetical protein